MSKNKTDKCTKDMMSHSAVCAFYPKSKMTKCLREASQIHEKCVSGVSSGDGYSSHDTSIGASRYKKSDGRVYINNSGGELPFNGKVWNGKCKAYYINGDLSYFTDRNGNYCDNECVLHSNNFN